jgi:hypothetical protein
MVLNLNIVELITPITSWNKKYFIKNIFYYFIKLFIIPLRTKFIR